MSHCVRFDVRMYRNGEQEAAVTELLPEVQNCIRKHAWKHRHEYNSMEEALEIGHWAVIEFLGVRYDLSKTRDARKHLLSTIHTFYQTQGRHYQKELDHRVPQVVADAVFLTRENTADDTVEDIETQIDRKSMIKRVRELLHYLTEEERTVYTLRYKEQLSYQAISKKLHKYPSKIKWIDQAICEKVRAGLVAEERKRYNKKK